MSPASQTFLALCGALVLLCGQQTEAKRITNGMLGKLAVGTMTTGEQPHCHALASAAQDLLDSMNAKADIAEQSLMDALGDLNNFEYNMENLENNTRANASDSATDDLLAASQDSSAAAEAKEKIDRMVELCTTLFAKVESFKIDSEDKAAMKRAQNDASLSASIQQVKDEMVAAEQQDLSNLIEHLNEILANKDRVEALDQIVGVGAADGIQQAVSLVEGYVEQLETRRDTLTTADAFADIPALQPEGAKMEIDRATSASLEVVFQKIIDIVQAKDASFKAALAKVSKLRRSAAKSNATDMKTLIQEMKAEGVAKANANALNGAIEKTVQSINVFFAALESYSSKQVVHRKVGTTEVQELTSQANDVLAEIDGGVLADAEEFFKIYAIMWLRASEAEDSLTYDNPEFHDVKEQVKLTAIAIHEWLNEELHSLCDYHGNCMKVRSLIFAEAQKKMNYCDERFTESRCSLEQSGYGPNGRSCKWVVPGMKAAEARRLGLRGSCQSLRPPTEGLKYHQEHEDGAGIFY